MTRALISSLQRHVGCLAAFRTECECWYQGCSRCKGLWHFTIILILIYQGHEQRTGESHPRPRAYWPEQRQEDAAKVLMLMEASDQSVYRLTDEQVAEVERRLADPNRRRLTLDEFKERLARRIEL